MPLKTLPKASSEVRVPTAPWVLKVLYDLGSVEDLKVIILGESLQRGAEFFGGNIGGFSDGSLRVIRERYTEPTET